MLSDILIHSGRFEEAIEEFNTIIELYKPAEISRENINRMLNACSRILERDPENHHAILHKQWREECQASFQLEYLPPYSPDLNPIERVWKLTRRQATHNRYFPYLEVVIMVVEGLFETWRHGNDSLRRLCAIT